MDIVNKSIDLENADISSYQMLLESLLRQSFEVWQFPENLQILASVIPSTYIYAAELSAPSKQNKKPSYKVFKSEEWRKAEISAKEASKKWTKAGKPRNEESELYKAKKETNTKLRSAIKVFNIEKETDET